MVDQTFVFADKLVIDRGRTPVNGLCGIQPDRRSRPRGHQRRSRPCRPAGFPPRPWLTSPADHAGAGEGARRVGRRVNLSETADGEVDEDSLVILGPKQPIGPYRTVRFRCRQVFFFVLAIGVHHGHHLEPGRSTPVSRD